LLDSVLETGEPLEIDRNGRKLRVIAVDQPPKLARLEPHPGFMKEAPENYVHIDWSGEWHPDID
jgi:hypothetical protein